MPYLSVSVGIPNEEDAHSLSRTLVEERVAAGTRISSGTSHFRWNGSVTERTYWTVIAFTTDGQLDRLYDLVADHSGDELPGITATEIDARDEYRQWIDANTR